MAEIDLIAAHQFLTTAYHADDWVAIFLKAYDTGRVSQRVGRVGMFCEPRWLTWLRVMNAYRFNVYVSVNTIRPGNRSRVKQAIAAVRHVFLDADREGPAVLSALAARSDLPTPSYVLHSSPNRLHVLWRASGFSVDAVEGLQKQLAKELGTDPAATPCSQTTRLPGFFNLKYEPRPIVTADYQATDVVCRPEDFPLVSPSAAVSHDSATVRPALGLTSSAGAFERARCYLAAVPPAIEGRHGDLHTFRICCRLVRGFALSDGDALTALADWNSRCEPPWPEADLLDKLQHARKYGREPFGGLLQSPR